MYASNYFETIMLNIARGISATAPAKMYLALFLNDPGEGGSGTEVSYSGYARQEIVFTAPAVDGTGMSFSNSAAITFATAQITVGNATFAGVFDSLTGGNMYVYGQLGTPITIESGVAPVVRANTMKWIWTGKFSNNYKTKIMNLMRGINVSGFTPYLALCNGSPEAGGSEFSGNSYARTSMTFSAPAEQANGSMMISNSTRVESPVASGTWGNLTHVALYDASTSGNPYLIDTSSSQVLMNIGKSVIYEAGTFNIYVN